MWWSLNVFFFVVWVDLGREVSFWVGLYSSLRISVVASHIPRCYHVDTLKDFIPAPRWAPKMFLQGRVPLRMTHVASVFSSSRLLCSVSLRLASPSPRTAEWGTCEGAPMLKLVQVQYADELRVKDYLWRWVSSSIYNFGMNLNCYGPALGFQTRVQLCLNHSL